MAKETLKKQEAVTLWEQNVDSLNLTEFKDSIADTEKLLIFGETGSGKTKFYIDIFRYLYKKGLKADDFLACIILPDRPTGLTKLVDFIPKPYMDRIEVFSVNNYEDTIKTTASAIRLLEEHYKKTGKFGYLVFELMENYWTFSQDYFCRNAYGKTMGEYFAQMQSIMGADKGDKRTAYEAFAGPFGGPWPIIKFFHNFNWIDKVKRLQFNTIFTSEMKEETNKDSIFFDLGYRPAGEKHNQHKMDTIIYASHIGNEFFIRAYKLIGYTKLYGKTKSTGKNDYETHLMCLEELEKRGFKVSAMDDLEQQAGITPPKKEVKVVEEEKTKEQKEIKKQDEEEKKEDDWELSL